MPRDSSMWVNQAAASGTSVMCAAEYSASSRLRHRITSSQRAARRRAARLAADLSQEP